MHYRHLRRPSIRAASLHMNELSEAVSLWSATPSLALILLVQLLAEEDEPVDEALFQLTLESGPFTLLDRLLASQNLRGRAGARMSLSDEPLSLPPRSLLSSSSPSSAL